MKIYYSDSGSVFIGTDGDAEEEETTEAFEKSIVDRTSHKNILHSDVEQNPDFIVPATPLAFRRYVSIIQLL